MAEGSVGHSSERVPSHLSSRAVAVAVGGNTSSRVGNPRLKSQLSHPRSKPWNNLRTSRGPRVYVGAAALGRCRARGCPFHTCRKPQASRSVPQRLTAEKQGEDLAILQKCTGARRRAQKPTPRVRMFGFWLCHMQHCRLGAVTHPVPQCPPAREHYQQCIQGEASK